MTTSKLARVLVVSTVPAALSLGGTAYARESGDPPAPGGVTQPDPQPTPDPDPAPDPEPTTPEPDSGDGIPDSWSDPAPW